MSEWNEIKHVTGVLLSQGRLKNRDFTVQMSANCKGIDPNSLRLMMVSTVDVFGNGRGQTYVMCMLWHYSRKRTKNSAAAEINNSGFVLN